jgi:thiol-disulfide isomerase/thioredoxin
VLLACTALACLAVAAVVLRSPERRHPPPRGAPAPALVDAAAKIDLASLKGRPVLVDFFASWCQPCAMYAAPAVAEVAHEHLGDLTVIGVALETPDTIGDLRAFMADHGVSWPVAMRREGFDDPLVAAWGVRGIPALFLVAPDGTIAANDLVRPSADATRAAIESALAELAHPTAAR